MRHRLKSYILIITKANLLERVFETNDVFAGIVNKVKMPS